MLQTVFIDRVLEQARKSNTGSAVPSVALKLRSAQSLEFAFMVDSVVDVVPGWVSGRCTVKEKPRGDVLLLDAALDCSGETTAARYAAVWTAQTLDGPNDGALRTFMADAVEARQAYCELQWIDADGTHLVSFPILLIPAFTDVDDEAPEPNASASWAWLKARIAAGDNITLEVDEEAKTITFTAADGGSVSWDGVTGKPVTFPPDAHTHAISNVTGLQGALDAKAAAALIGANNGIAPLDSGGKVPAGNLPSYVDDVIEAANFAALPASGETGKIYVTLDTGKTYRWSGSAYVLLNELPAFASQAEAEAGIDNTKLMTPLRTAQAVAALGSGGGKVVQVAYAVKNDTASGTSSSPATFFSGSITPTSAGNQVLVFLTGVGSGTAGYLASVRVVRGSTVIVEPAAPGNRQAGQTSFFAGGSAEVKPFSLAVLDTPGSTAALTYNAQIWCEPGGTWFINRSLGNGDNSSYSNAVTTMILMELAP